MDHKIIIITASALILSLLSVSCSSSDSSGSNISETGLKEPALTSSADITAPVSTAVSSSENINSSITDPSVMLSLIDKHYIFSTGAGGWSTKLTIDENGNFNAFYSDGNYVSSENEADIYKVDYCAFSGKFGSFKVTDDHTLTMKLIDIECHKDYEYEEHSGSRTEYRELPYGMESADTIYIYRRGTRTSDLPENCLDWLSMSLSWGRVIPETTEQDIIYNPLAQSLFISRSDQ